MQKSFSVVVLDKNPNSREILEAFLKTFDFIDNIQLYENYWEGLEEIKNTKPVVIMDISSKNSETETILNSIKLYASKLLITSSDYSTDTIIWALRAGAKEFLPKPVIKEDLERVLYTFLNYTEETSESKIISVYSNKGGIGKTTVAINLAAELAKVTGEKVALIDLNLQLGDISTFLNLNPAIDVNYVIKKLLNKEDTVVEQAFEKYKNTTLYVLSDPYYIEQSESITPTAINELFNVLRKVFPYIIVDMSANIDANTLKILDSSDFIMFTTIINIPAIRNTQRCLNLFNSRRYPSNKIKILVNRYMDNDEIKIEDIESTLGNKIYWKIPNNYFTIMEAINKGVIVSEVNASSNISNSFRDFAIKISNDIIEQSVIKYQGNNAKLY